MLICDLCNKKIKQSDHDTDGEHDFHSKCWQDHQKEGALMAGIPLSVIEGKTKLTDHFSKEYIDYKCNRESKNEIS